MDEAKPELKKEKRGADRRRAYAGAVASVGAQRRAVRPDPDPPGPRMADALVGNTPILRLRRVVEPGMAEVWVKLEGANPAGSIKDRTALGMIEDAERRGILTPGTGQTIVEPSSGNTGIGLAFLAAVRGYRCVIVLPDDVNIGRVKTLEAYGAGLEFTQGHLGMQAAILRAREIEEATGAWMAHQFENPANPEIHFRVTGPELWNQVQGRIDAFVGASGTGGSLSGIGRYLKQQRRSLRVVAVEPARSAVINGFTRGRHAFQDMGPGFLPRNLDLAMLDACIMVYEEAAFPLVRRLAREEGILVGMSSGAAVFAALEEARRLGPGNVVVTLAADTAARCLSTSLFADTPAA